MSDEFITEPDVVLIGAGIISATLGVFLKELEPSLSIESLMICPNHCSLRSRRSAASTFS